MSGNMSVVTLQTDGNQNVVTLSCCLKQNEARHPEKEITNRKICK